MRRGQDGPDYVSRGAHKLVGALDAFGLDVAGRHALDAGASTGGFSDVLLRRGVAAVVAVDVGYGQLAWPIRSDERVTVLERTNVRDLTAEHAARSRPDLVVGDLSFISLRAGAAAAGRGRAPTSADLVLMVKPQFEVGKDHVGAGGVVRDPALRSDAVRRIAAAAWELGLGTAGVVASPAARDRAATSSTSCTCVVGPSRSTSDDLARAIEEGPQ